MGFGQNLRKLAVDSFIGKGLNVINPSTYRRGLVSVSGSQITYQVISSFINFALGKSSYAQFMKTFRESPLVYMIVNKIAFTSASIDRVYKGADGEILETSKIKEALETPNSSQSRVEFLNEIGECLKLTGNAFIQFVKGVGAGTEMRIWKPQNVVIETDKFGVVLRYKYTEIDNTVTTIEAETKEVLHIKNSTITQDVLGLHQWGVSPLEAMWIVVKSSNEKFGAEASIFKNRGIIGILTNESDIPMQPTERDDLQKQFDDEVGGHDRFNKIKVSTTKLKYIQTGMSPTDLKLLEGIVSSLRLLCAAYCIPSVLFNDTDQSTYNNMVEAKKSAYDDAYLPLCNQIDSKLSVWLSGHLGVNETIECDLTSIEVLRNTTNELMQNLNALEPRIAARVIDALGINDVLNMVGLDEIEGGEERFGSLSSNNTTSNGDESKND